MMPEIVLTEEQLAILRTAGSQVLVRDNNGHTWGLLDPQEASVMAEAQQRLANQLNASPVEAVRSRLAQLQEMWDSTGGFDEATMLKKLHQLREDNHGTV